MDLAQLPCTSLSVISDYVWKGHPQLPSFISVTTLILNHCRWLHPESSPTASALHFTCRAGPYPRSMIPSGNFSHKLLPFISVTMLILISDTIRKVYPQLLPRIALPCRCVACISRGFRCFPAWCRSYQGLDWPVNILKWRVVRVAEVLFEVNSLSV